MRPELDSLPQGLVGLFPLAGMVEQNSELIMGLGRVRNQPRDFPALRDGLLGLPSHRQYLGEPPAQHPVAGFC